MIHLRVVFALSLFITGSNAFAPSSTSLMTNVPKTSMSSETKLFSMTPVSDNPFDQFVDNIKIRIRIAQESNASGAGNKQVIADVIAGEYDSAPIMKQIDDLVSSSPCVMFTWEASPSCKKAVEAFSMMGADVKICRLDDPWSEGNIMRSALGKKYGRSSVPFVFINGEYIGGFDDGTGDKAPGMVDMAFKGTLRPKLAKAGAMMLD